MKKGYALVTVLLLITVFVLIGVALLTAAQSNVWQSKAVYEAEKLYYAAESAVQVAAQRLPDYLGADMNGALISEPLSQVLGGDYEIRDRAAAEDVLKNKIQPEIKKVIINAVNALAGDLNNAVYNEMETSILPLKDGGISFRGGGVTDDMKKIIVGAPEFSVTAQSGGRRVSVNMALAFSGSVDLVADDVGQAIIDNAVDAGGGGYYKNNRQGFYGHLPLKDADFYIKELHYDFTFNHEPEILADPAADPPVFNSVKEAEYYTIVKAVNAMLDKYDLDSGLGEAERSARWETLMDELLDTQGVPPDASIFPRLTGYTSLGTSSVIYLTPEKGVGKVKSSVISTLAIRGSADPDNPTVFDQLEYLYADRMSITGYCSFPKLKGLYVNGNLMLGVSRESDGGGISLTGAPDGSTKIYAGKIDIDPRGDELRGDLVNVQLISYKNPISISVMNAKDRSFFGNAVFICAYDRGPAFEFSNISSGSQIKTKIGNNAMAPQFYARGTINLISLTNMHSAAEYYGIYASASENPFVPNAIYSGNSYKFVGMTVGNLVNGSSAPHSAAGGETLNSEPPALLNSQFSGYLSKAFSNDTESGGSPEDGTRIIKFYFTAGEALLAVSSVESLHETTEKGM